MLFIRSLLFNIALYIVTIIVGILFLPCLLLPRIFVETGLRIWTHSIIVLMRLILNLKIEIRGLDKIKTGQFLFASKHQSMLETVVLPGILYHAAFVLKKELSYIPLYGWHAAKIGMIFVDRKAGFKTIKTMLERAQRQIKNGRSVAIFPEGTRVAVGEKAAYNPGVAALYKYLKVPCIPIALNTGVFWKRRGFTKRPGTAVIEILDPIAPGLDKDVFMQKLEDTIETATEKLIKS
ncbi:MAG: 1-acyl-sn-glycerol-3-phosphate acyltransferase [Spirochaetes bacterium]|nr:1-acyl-sn-glycerol-3-phosphate acyltransferase [Spirochaetota bacterium]